MRGSLLWLVFLLALGATAAAQNTPGTKLHIVMADGSERKLHAFGWKGISAQAVSGVGVEAIERRQARTVCFEVCPPGLPNAAVSIDTAVWKNGETTQGPLVVSCGSLDECFLIQSGQRRSLRDVAYVQFAAP